MVDGSNPFGATINLGSLFFSAGSAFWLFFTFIAWAAQHLMQKFCAVFVRRTLCAVHLQNSTQNFCKRSATVLHG
ncbi:MAG: hypothetical protein SPH13_07925 [Campylobacter sp.]|nr:hypothetical protein [Campylobacter sp.]